jgi:putative tricarboxylic transport membrane protein
MSLKQGESFMTGQLIKNKNFLMGSIVTLVGIGMLADAINFGRFISGGIGADFFPKIISSALILMGLLLGAEGYRVVREQAGKHQGASQEAIKNNYLEFAAVLGVLTVYVIVLRPLGFILSTVPFTFLLILILSSRENRRVPLFAIIAVIVTVAVYFLFVKVFYVMLPVGILG